MKYAFFGSFRISADILSGLLDAGYIPETVICNPDKPVGKRQVVTPPAVKQLILERKLPIKILQPEKIETEKLANELKTLDVAVVMGYPKIIPQATLSMPRLGTIGVHPSLLPKYRGASPIQSVLLNGEQETGVTLYLIDKEMDHGPILASRKYQVANGTTNAELERQLTAVAVKLLIETLPKFIAGEIKPIEQDHSAATFTKKFTSADGQVDFVKDDPLAVYRKIKAFYPEPSVWTMNFPGYEGKRVKLLEADFTGGKIHIRKIQVEGKRPISLLSH